jgi:hypothetical protein
LSATEMEEWSDIAGWYHSRELRAFWFQEPFLRSTWTACLWDRA